MTHNAVLLDTSFFLRFLNDKDPLFKSADGYFRYFLQNEIEHDENDTQRDDYQACEIPCGIIKQNMNT